jgi:hypothetical protein
MKKVPSSGDIFLARAIAGIFFLIEVGKPPCRVSTGRKINPVSAGRR